MRTHTETERKYEAGADTELPALTGMTGRRTEELSAIYFDTADQRLARHGATLRRRTGGGDAGWHLKVPAGADSRTELRLPLDDTPEHATNAPPDELVELTTAMARGAELRPVARIKTDRTVWELHGADGAVLAEVTDDHVSARLLSDESTVDKWREIEVELVDGDTSALDRIEKALRKAGIRRAGHGSKLAKVLPPPAVTAPSGEPAGDALLSYVYEQFATIVTQDLRVRRDEPDSVHRLRVAARRLRSALRVYRGILGGTKRLRDELKWLGRRLAPARDLEVQENHFRAELAALPTEQVVGPVSARLTRHYGPLRAEAREVVLKTLRGKRYRELLTALDRLLTDPQLTRRARRRAKKELPKHVRKARRRMVKRHASGRPLHEVRKAAKAYRYALEVPSASAGRKSRKRAKAVTKVLGAHQDGLVAQPVLRELGMRAHLSGENGFTFGLLHEREAGRIAAAAEEFPKLWRRLV